MELFINQIPKAELHVHIEGTLEPELIFKLSKKNKIKLNYSSLDELKAAYKFRNLQTFLNIYYDGSKVLLNKEDFYDLTLEFIEKLKAQNICHAEIFFDPQAHTQRGVKFENIINGIYDALVFGREKYGISFGIIMCFLRHLSPHSAMETLEEAIPFKEKIIGVGLDSSEVGNPPSKFSKVFEKARSLGFLPVAHAGEEGPPEYIWETLNDLKVLRIDHGIRCLEDKKLTDELVRRQIPLTVCPLSNIRLGVFNSMEKHNIKKMLDLGLNVSVNSDDPAYFGGYVNENLFAVQKAFNLTKEEIVTLAKNSVSGSFLLSDEKERIIKTIEEGYRLVKQ
jgi:adenosine deaminase